ncbi:hypothetical protein PDL71_15790 [Lacibacter sp. MH-610]|uniref:hypothetical protein n=1 Tax=Lacibacter sp. MH-610 TaxID=3020883 RepID=UPI003892AE3F
MTKDKIKNLLDFVPVIILTVYAIIMLWTVSTTDIVLQSEHYAGFTLLIITVGLFIMRHKLGVLSLGLTLLLGVFKVLSYSAAITFYSFGGTINGHSSPDIKIQAVFLLWLLIHFIVSGRHYVGIATKSYWQDLFAKPIEIPND